MNNHIWIIEIVNTKDRVNEIFPLYFFTRESVNDKIKEFEKEDEALGTTYFNYYTHKLYPSE